ELWKSDGTAAGTVMVKDIIPGGAGSNPGGAYGYIFTNVNGTLYFSADDGAHGQELWKSDGTAAGTVLVADINPGSGFSNPGDLTNVLMIEERVLYCSPRIDAVIARSLAGAESVPEDIRLADPRRIDRRVI